MCFLSLFFYHSRFSFQTFFLQGKIESGISKKAFKLPISSKSSEPITLPLQSPANEITDKFSRFPFHSPMSSDLHPVSTPIVTEGSSAIKEFPTMGFASTSNDLEHRNSSLFSPVKGENSVFSSPSLATSPPLLKHKAKGCIEIQGIQPLPTETMPSLGEDEIEMPCSSAAAMTFPSNENVLAAEESKPHKQVIETETTVDFQADFIRRIVHDVEDNLREVLRCRFGDLIIQSAQQFLTLQVNYFTNFFYFFKSNFLF